MGKFLEKLFGKKKKEEPTVNNNNTIQNNINTQINNNENQNNDNNMQPITFNQNINTEINPINSMGFQPIATEQPELNVSSVVAQSTTEQTQTVVDNTLINNNQNMQLPSENNSINNLTEASSINNPIDYVMPSQQIPESQLGLNNILGAQNNPIEQPQPVQTEQVVNIGIENNNQNGQSIIFNAQPQNAAPMQESNIIPTMGSNQTPTNSNQNVSNNENM